MSEERRLHPDIDTVLPIDAEMLAQFAPFAANGSARPRFQVTVTDLQTGEQRDIILNWPFAQVDDLALTLFRALSGSEPSELDLYLWVYWRAWAGCLDPAALQLVPVGAAIVEKVGQGQPLRGAELDLLANGLGWHFANSAAEFGDGNWKQGTLSAPHSRSRKAVKEYVHSRMIALHGEDYRDA